MWIKAKVNHYKLIVQIHSLGLRSIELHCVYLMNEMHSKKMNCVNR